MAATWLNNPQGPWRLRVVGHQAAMNGVLNLSILDGWWPEGWCMEAPAGRSAAATRARQPDDLVSLYDADERSDAHVYKDRPKWISMMRASK